jgi:Zn-dependent protease with chaperone function
LTRSRFSPAGNKRLLLSALVLPPILAAIPTFGGATLRHSHAREELEHHSMACREMFASLFAGSNSLGVNATASSVLGALVNGLAWLLVGVGIFYVVRLVHATLHLERGLAPYLIAPSPKLRQSLVRVGRQLPALRSGHFHECAIPAGYSSVLGLRRVRCVLSRDFVAAATDDELDAVVAHEACHIRAHDVWATLLVGALNCVFFPLRPVRLLARRWREEAEIACDDAAVRATRRPLAMASAILRASGEPVSLGAKPALPAVVMPFADEAACAPEKRVTRLLAQAKTASLPAATESRAQVWGGWLVTSAFAVLGFFLLHSAQVVCFAHCSLEAVARLLP